MNVSRHHGIAAVAIGLAFMVWPSLICCGGEVYAEDCVQVQPSEAAGDATVAIQRAVQTGRCVHLVSAGRELIVSHDIVITKPGQIIYGDGRFATRLRSGDPHGFKRGMFVATTGEPGPIFRDFGVFYNQPETSLPGHLITYPPAFALDATPRFRMEHMGCYLATVCVEARHNSGGAILDDVQLTAFSIGIDVDDALDSVRLENIQWYPFYLTAKLSALFISYQVGHAVGIKLGRVDDFHIVDGLFLGGLALTIGPSATDGVVGFGSVRGCDFDGGYGIAIGAVGSVDIVGNEFTLGVPNATSLSMANGIASIVGNKFLMSGPGRPIAIGGGMATIAANNFAIGAVDATLLTQGGAQTQVVFNGNVVAADGAREHVFPLVDFRQGDLVATSNIVSPLQGGGTGVAIRVGKEAGATRIDANIMAGWQIVKPSASP